MTVSRNRVSQLKNGLTLGVEYVAPDLGGLNRLDLRFA